MRAAAVVVLAAGGALVALGTGTAARPRTAGSGAFATVVPAGLGWKLELRSPASGRVLRIVARFASSLTDNGLALSPDGRAVYVTLIPRGGRWRNLKLERIDVATGRRALIARGQQPALSPDGRRLAYAVAMRDGATGIAVRGVGSGAARMIDLGPVAGRPTDPLNARLAWLGDGSDLAVVTRSPATAARSSPQGEAASSAGSRLVIVDAAQGTRLSARWVAVGGLDGPVVLGGDAAHPHSVLVATLGPGDRAVVERITLGGSGSRVRRIASIPAGLALAFDPAGRRLLYLRGHSPPALWVATLGAGHLLGARRLVPNANLGAVAW